MGKHTLHLDLKNATAPKRTARHFACAPRKKELQTGPLGTIADAIWAFIMDVIASGLTYRNENTQDRTHETHAMI